MRFILMALFCFIGTSEGRYKGDPNKVLDTVPVLSPYYGQTWECLCVKDIYLKIDTIKVNNVSKEALMPFDGGPAIPCDRLRFIKK